MKETTTSGQGRATGVATLVASAFSTQLGAASASLAFPALGPVGVVAVRQLIAAAVLVSLVRPRCWALSRHQWWPVLGLAVVFATMNLTLYASIERIGLGLAVTLEFLGPLAVALLSSRTRTGAVCGMAAGAGVVAITGPEASTDYLGVGLALMAAVSWAAYIVLNRTVGRRVPGVQGTATATGVSASLLLPAGAAVFLSHPPEVSAVLWAVGAGVLASVVPYVVDLTVLRRVPAHLFGVLMSLNPVFAALIGALVLHEVLGVVQWVGIALIVTANAGVVLRVGRAPQSP